MKMMKTLMRLLLILPAISILFLFPSCLNEDSNDADLDGCYVTVVPGESGSFYLVTDEGETLEPIKNYTFKPERRQRAVAVFTLLEKESVLYDRMIDVHRLDTFLTKPIVENLGDRNTEVYGNDPVFINKYWIGDGFLNIWFSTYQGNKTHVINLIQADPENNPYELEFRHNANNDSRYQIGYGIVAFDLSTLPSTNGEKVKLRFKFNEEGTGIRYSEQMEYNSKAQVLPGNPEIPQATLPGNRLLIFN
ncbi:MAG: NigD-like protein [Tannerellaceae bacterium]|nr:NigD-like protein [Tannerellaceae bacterium]